MIGPEPTDYVELSETSGDAVAVADKFQVNSDGMNYGIRHDDGEQSTLTAGEWNEQKNRPVYGGCSLDRETGTLTIGLIGSLDTPPPGLTLKLSGNVWQITNARGEQTTLAA